MKVCAATCLLMVCLILQACSSPIERMTERATQAQLGVIEVMGDPFRHLVFERRDAAEDTQPLLVFIEGDGIPWRYEGLQRNPDPRPKHALAFELFLATPQPGWYITRPCYDAHLDAAECTPLIWTDQRYSPTVVASMAAALHRHAAANGVRQLILIGYSGGGTLAVLLANQLSEAVGVISLAANLDVQAWATDHHFSPLSGSLNPASDTSDLSVPHLVLHGAMDSNVTPASLVEFQRSHPSSHMQFIDGYDHVCCWERDWRALLPQALAELSLLQHNAK